MKDNRLMFFTGLLLIGVGIYSKNIVLIMVGITFFIISVSKDKNTNK